MKNAFILVFMVITIAVYGQVKIGNNASTIDPSAVLELEKTNQGLLITRISLASASDNTTIASPANSLLIYNISTAGSGGDLVSPGFYFWDSGLSRWKGLLTSSGPSGDVWIDANNNILSNNSANQTLTGSSSLALGLDAFGDPVDPSNYVIAIGTGACSNETTAGDAYVVAIGANTAQNNSGILLNAFGKEAAQNNQGESVNALGEGAARNNQGSLVNAFGGAAGENNTGWSTNMFGNQSGQFNTGAELNAMGAMSAQYNTHASVNAFGLTAAQYNQNADVNALGWRAAQYNTGFQVNAFGSHAGRFNNGDHTIAIGQYAVMGDSLVYEGHGNIGIGYSAASNVNGGAYNICIGHDADIPDSTASYQINIGNSIIREADGLIRLKDFIQLTPMSSPPSSSEEGIMYYNVNDHKVYVRIDTGWQALW